VEELATSHGVHSGENRKTVWFELWPEAPAPPPSAWETVAPPGRTVTVTLNDVPYALYWAAQQHWEGLLRELFLTASCAGGTVVRPEQLAVAQDMSNVICACMTVAVEQETPDSSTLSLLVGFPADAGADVVTLGGVLDEADAAAQRESLLVLPALPQLRAFRHWLFDQIASQLPGGHPTAWTLAPGAPSTTPAGENPSTTPWSDSACTPPNRHRIPSTSSATN
jgi:hypothetical protein